MTPEEWIRKIAQQQERIRHTVSRVLPVKVGVLAEGQFKDNFLKGGFVNNGLQKWKPAKRQLSGKKDTKTKNKTLVASGLLYKSIGHVTGAARVVVQNKVPYAAVHNEGLRAGRGRGFQMPRRQFIGDSRELNEKVEKTIDTELRKIIEN